MHNSSMALGCGNSVLHTSVLPMSAPPEENVPSAKGQPLYDTGHVKRPFSELEALQAPSQGQPKVLSSGAVALEPQGAHRKSSPPRPDTVG